MSPDMSPHFVGGHFRRIQGLRRGDEMGRREKEREEEGATGLMGCAGMMRHQRKGLCDVENEG